MATKIFLSHYRKQPRERLEYVIDYSDWLAESEELASAQVEIKPDADPDDLKIDAVFLVPGSNNTQFGYLAYDGVSGVQYQVTILATTTNNQVVEREILYSIEEF